jgi:hypothetical protein
MGLFSKTKGLLTCHIGCLKDKFDAIPQIKSYLTHRKHSNMIQLTKVVISLSKSKRIQKIRRSFIRCFATITMTLQTEEAISLQLHSKPLNFTSWDCFRRPRESEHGILGALITNMMLFHK